MNRLLTAVIAAGGSLALAGGVLLTTAMPAAAGAPAGGNSSYGASAPAGPVTAAPQALAQQTGPTLQFVSNVDISGLLSTGLTLDTASALAAFSRVTSVDAGVSFGGQTVSLVARQVSSTCRSDTRTASANLIGGVLTVNGTAINLPSHPTADETFTFAWRQGDPEQPVLGHRRRRRGPSGPPSRRHPYGRPWHPDGPGPLHRRLGLQQPGQRVEHDHGHQPG